MVHSRLEQIPLPRCTGIVVLMRQDSPYLQTKNICFYMHAYEMVHLSFEDNIFTGKNLMLSE